MTNAVERVTELIFGHWRSQTLYAGAELGIFDHLATSEPKTAEVLGVELGLDAALLYRLLRAEACIGLLVEDQSKSFVLTNYGELLRSDHQQSLRAMARLAEGPQHYAIWKHLPAMIRDGKQNGFLREFGREPFEQTRHDRDYADRFNNAMSSYSVARFSTP